MKYDRISGFADEIAEDVDTQFRVLNKLDIRYFEPRGIDGKNIAELSDGEVAALKEKMERCGIKASSIGSPIGKIRLDEDFQAHFEKFQRVVDIAERLDAGYIRMFSFYPPERPDSAAGEGDGAAHEWTAGEREEVIRRLRRMTAYAGERDVVLLHENEKGIYGDTAERCADLMRELGCRHFQAVFDPANFVQCGQDTKEAYEALRSFIAYVHVKDARVEDRSVVPAGAGDGNVGHILKGLLDSGYEGYLSLEPHLGSFSGLADLELDDKMQNLPQGGEGTFTLAYRALEAILDKIIR